MLKAISLIILPRSMSDVELTDLPMHLIDARGDQPAQFNISWLRRIGSHKLGIYSFIVEERDDLRFFTHGNCFHIDRVDQAMATGSRPAIRIKEKDLQPLLVDLARWEASFQNRNLVEFCDGSSMRPTGYNRA